MTEIRMPDDTVGAFVPHTLSEPLRGSGTGPLAGLTFAVKDLYDIAGRKTGNGSHDFLAWTKPASETAPSVRKLLDAGADCVGVTTCDTFFYTLTGAHDHYVTPGDARTTRRMPGTPHPHTPP